MAEILKALGWGNTTNVTQSLRHPPNSTEWDYLPDLVQLEIFKYLDKKSLTNLRQVSASARDLIENVHGIEVIIPARNWVASWWVQSSLHGNYRVGPRKLISDSLLRHIVLQMEGKKITSLEMTEMPPMFDPFDFTRFVTYPRQLEHVKLKYVDVKLLHDIFSRCVNLKSFECKTGTRRQLPRGILAMILLQTSFAPVPVPPMNNELTRKIATFPDTPLKMDRLNKLHLTMHCSYSQYHSDWGNVIYCLLALPKLPALQTFHFAFSSSKLLSWQANTAVLSCIGEFLSKTPNLQVFQYHFTCKYLPPDLQDDATHVLCFLMNLFGSEALKELAEAMTGGPAPVNSFMSLARPIMSTAGRTLTCLQKLDLIVGNDFINDVLTELVRNIPNPTMTTAKIIEAKSFVGYVDGNVDRHKISDLFTLPVPSGRNGLPPLALEVRPLVVVRLPVYESVTKLDLHLDFLFQPPISLNKIMQNLPILRSFYLGLGQNPRQAMRHHGTVTIRFPENPQEIANLFSHLEKLNFENVLIVNVENGTNVAGRVLMLCKNLKELSFVADSMIWDNVEETGISGVDVLSIISTLRKLNKVKVHVTYFLGQLRLHNWIGYVDPNALLSPAGRIAKNALGRVGQLIDLPQMWRQVNQPQNRHFITSSTFSINGTLMGEEEED